MTGTDGKEKKPDDVLLKIEAGANNQGDPVIFVTDFANRLILGLTVPQTILRDYIKEQGGEIEVMDALHQLLSTTFEAIIASLTAAIKDSKSESDQD